LIIVLALGEEADFSNTLPALNFDKSTKLDLTTEPAFCQAPVRLVLIQYMILGLMHCHQRTLQQYEYFKISYCFNRNML
jgi:hypothetical protein